MAAEMVQFNNQHICPALGLGTWKSQPNEVTQAVKDAIDIGYRHIDCAPVYKNEEEVGAAIAAKIKEGVIRREDLFITSKLWNTCHRPDLVEPALKKTLKDLCVETLDLYLMHTPMAFKEGGDDFPVDSNGKLQCSDVDFVDTWKAMEALLKKGLVKNIGVSNFNSKQIERLLSKCEVKPVTNQVECHPYFTQTQLSNWCNSKEIKITAYSPFASPDRPFASPDEPRVLDDQKIKQLAAKYKKTPAQIILRHQIQRGHLVIPKSVARSRIQENFDIFNFDLSQADMMEMNSLDRKRRVCGKTIFEDHKDFPFNIEF